MPKRFRQGGHGGYIRGTAEYISGTKIKFVWPCGHTQTQDFSKGPIVKRMGPTACKMMARWWRDGVNLQLCNKGRCKRA